MKLWEITNDSKQQQQSYNIPHIYNYLQQESTSSSFFLSSWWIHHLLSFTNQSLAVKLKCSLYMRPSSCHCSQDPPPPPHHLNQDAHHLHLNLQPELPWCKASVPYHHQCLGLGESLLQMQDSHPLICLTRRLPRVQAPKFILFMINVISFHNLSFILICLSWLKCLLQWNSLHTPCGCMERCMFYCFVF